VLRQNAKGHTKSLESGDLWCIHRETGRLLPYPGGEGATVEDRGEWYRATLAAENDAAPGATESGSRKAHATAAGGADTGTQARTAGGATAAGGADAGTQARTAGGAADAGRDAIGATADIGVVLRELAEVVRSRHEKLPEGSYTTHLFTAGAQKIRKKLGEEAVELVLGEKRDELVSESADLLYHLLVFLEAEGISLGEIAGELRKR
jgi:phosphoribosyl-ATP pyrophosphohydrolase